MVIWSSTELLMTIICSSIIVLRPLYVKLFHGSKNDSSNHTPNIPLPMLVGKQQNSRKQSLADPYSNVYAGKGASACKIGAVKHNSPANTSEESILGEINRENECDAKGIRRTDEVMISYGNNTSSDKTV